MSDYDPHIASCHKTVSCETCVCLSFHKYSEGPTNLIDMKSEIDNKF